VGYRYEYLSELEQQLPRKHPYAYQHHDEKLDTKSPIL
jgi:hypothetical protein